MLHHEDEVSCRKTPNDRPFTTSGAKSQKTSAAKPCDNELPLKNKSLFDPKPLNVESCPGNKSPSRLNDLDNFGFIS